MLFWMEYSSPTISLSPLGWNTSSRNGNLRSPSGFVVGS